MATRPLRGPQPPRPVSSQAAWPPSSPSPHPPAPVPQNRHGSGFVKKTLTPNQRGTKKLLLRYGSALVCVRYRENLALGWRSTTVELVIDQHSFQPHPDQPVLVRLALKETELRQRACRMGARWNERRKAWAMSYSTAKTLQLLNRILAK